MTRSPKPELTVVGAVIVRNGLVFCTRRANGLEAGKWEFPGGKVEPAETPAQALRREIQEELGVDIVVGEKITTAQADNPKAIINLSTYLCTIADDANPTLSEDHSESVWLDPNQLSQLEWPVADLPTVEMLKSYRAAQGN